MCCNGCGTRIIQVGAAAPFTFSVTGGNSPYNGGLGVITGPIVINSGDILHLFSLNTIDFNVTPGSVNVQGEVRLDPNILNTITSSPAGLLSLGGGGGVNLYNSDGTLTDPSRVATIGLSTMTWDAVGVSNSTVQTHNANLWQASTQDIVSGDIHFVATTPGQIITEANSPSNDLFSRSINTVFGAVAISSSNVGGNSWSTLLEQGFNYFDFSVLNPNYFELRLQGNAGNSGEIITSQGIGVSPIWAPVTVTANSLDNLFFSQNIDWDFGGFNWNIVNIDNWSVAADDISFTSNTFDVSAPVACFSGIIQNDALTRFLVQDVGGCLSWRDASTVGGDSDWLTIQTTTPELLSANNAWRQGGIGIVGFPHSTNTPFDTNDLIYDIEVASQNRGTIGVNGTPNSNAEISFQLVTARNGGIQESAISIGSHVTPGISTIPNLTSPANPLEENLLISHKRDSNGPGDTPILMFYGSGSSNTEASVVVTDAQTASFVSLPLEMFEVAASTKTPRILITNENVIAKNASLYFTTFNNVNRGIVSMGEYMNAGGSIIDSTSDSMFFSQAGAGNPMMSFNPVTGGVYIGNGFPQIAGLQDLYVQGANQLVTFGDYPSTRNDTGSFAPVNFLYTNASGDILSAPTSALPSGGSSLSNIVSLRQTVFGGQGFVNNVETDITWETAEIDTNSIATVGAGTGFITIGTTGIYEIHTAINWDTQANNTGFRQIGIKINGVTNFLTSKLVTENPVQYLTRIVNLTAGDIVTVYGFHQTFPGTIRTRVNATQNEASLLHLKKIG